MYSYLFQVVYWKINIYAICYLCSVLFLSRCMQCRRGLAMRKLSVILSVKRVICDKTEERSVQIFLHHTKDHLA